MDLKVAIQKKGPECHSKTRRLVQDAISLDVFAFQCVYHKTKCHFNWCYKSERDFVHVLVLIFASRPPANAIDHTRCPPSHQMRVAFDWKIMKRYLNLSFEVSVGPLFSRQCHLGYYILKLFDWKIMKHYFNLSSEVSMRLFSRQCHLRYMYWNCDYEGLFSCNPNKTIFFLQIPLHDTNKTSQKHYFLSHNHFFTLIFYVSSISLYFKTQDISNHYFEL